MCGITGFSGISNFELLRQMNNVLFHRGPDDSGEFIDKNTNTALAMRRLSIIDLEGGHQPMGNEDSSVWIVFNGEIFNFRKLREELIINGHIFKSNHSDTEVLIHLYEQEGFKMLSKLNGMFAFVLYDKNKKTLFGARDRMGIKPLYYVCKNGLFAFASEIKSLRFLGEVSRQIDYQSLYDYMSFQFVPSPRTIFADIKKIPAAHYFVFDVHTKIFQVCRYWDIPQFSERIKLDQAVDLVRDEAKRAVVDWSVSDVPIACSLSGGIDSSSVVGLLCASGINQLRTFSLGFNHRKDVFFDERGVAKSTSQRWGTLHSEIVLEPDDLLEDLDVMVWHLDEPYGGGLPSWYVFKAMRGKVKVALTGTGGDELFGIYGYWRQYEKLFWRLRETAKLSMYDRSVFSSFSMLNRYPQGYLYHRYFTENMKRKWLFNQEILNQVSPTELYLQKLWDEVKDRTDRDIVAYIHYRTQLPEEFLHMTDRFSMAHSIEARTPFLDHKLVELLMSIPSEVRTKDKSLKYLFIKAMRGVLTDEVVNFPKKGFVLPIDRWLRTSLKDKVDYYLGESYIKKQGLFTKDFYSHLVKPYFNGKKYLDDFVWTVLMFQLWYDRFVENG